MCGINFVLTKRQDDTRAERMLGRIQHRGIRGNTFVMNDGQVQLSHQRLPIQGLSQGFDQPYFYKDYVIGFVGEIFNFRDFNPDAESDIQVLAEEFDRSGIECFKKFDGFWSVIIIDRSRGCYHVVTDSLAKKPLYIKEDSDYRWISSEIFPLLDEGDEFDPLYFSSVAKWGYSLSNLTPFKRIWKIPNFCHLIGSLTDLRNSSMIQYDAITPKSGSIRHLLEEAVENRLVSDVPVSILLSGGMDSSIIFELMKKHTHNFTVFHVDNEEAEYLNYLDIPSDIKVKKIKLMETSYPEALAANQTPVDLGSVHPQLSLAKAIKKEGFVVAISGDGADELFGGYTRAVTYDSQYSDIFEELIWYHLPRLDRIMMNQTIELRCPFLSRPVVEAALTLPWSERQWKNGLKKIFKYLVPKEILYRDKRALKINDIRKDPIKARLNAIRLFKGFCRIHYDIKGD